MKTKSILIVLTGIILLAGISFFVWSKKTVKPGKGEIRDFLDSFRRDLKTGDTNLLLTYFETDDNGKAAMFLINTLLGRTPNGIVNPDFRIDLDTKGSNIKMLNTDFSMAEIIVSLSSDSTETKHTNLTFTIHRVGERNYRITKIKAEGFLAAYYAYKATILNKVNADRVKYDPLTLAAFKTAGQLKTKYDSVIWFAHVGGKTYFYVVKGKWDIDKDVIREKDSVIEPYKMGLVSPDLKEIIPAEYDLVHNINGTFKGLVEVEKDNKKGFYDLNGKVVIPVNYDQVFPIGDGANLAVLRRGNDYFYLKRDTSISEKVDLKIGDFFSKIKNIGNSYNLYNNALSVITEYNSHQEHGAIYLPPSYLVELNMAEKEMNFENPLRKGAMMEEVHRNYNVGYSDTKKDTANWLVASFYSIRDYFLGGRSEFYDRKNLVIVDKRSNRMFTQNIPTDYSGEEDDASFTGICDVNSIKVINDSLFEVKSGAVLSMPLYDSTKMIEGGDYYHYLAVRNNKLVELPDERKFGFTKYIKMDDSYLNGCYNLLTGTGPYESRQKKTLDHITPEMLRYMKNEIYAEYHYHFKDKRWQEIFTRPEVEAGPDNANIDDMLTETDKFNINWITQKLKGERATPNTLASNTLASR